MAPITVKWVDVQKGDGVRCRLVALDFKAKHEGDRADLFASMPPREAKKFLFSKAASQKGKSRVKKLLFMDATKANLNGPTGEAYAFVDLPPELAKAGRCAKLDF